MLTFYGLTFILRYMSVSVHVQHAEEHQRPLDPLARELSRNVTPPK